MRVLNISNNVYNTGVKTELYSKKQDSFCTPSKTISAKGYHGDAQPLQKMFWVATGRNAVYEDIWTKENFYWQNGIKWLKTMPSNLLKRSLEQMMQSVCTLAKNENSYPLIPSNITTPNYGNQWGRCANYIEINPRIVAKYFDGNISDGLLGVMKILPAIPPRGGNFANCVILSQLYPTLGADGKTYDESLYCVKLNSGFSKNIIAPGLMYKVGDDEQVKAFNDIAHLLGFKTGFRMPLSAGQIQLGNRNFNWWTDENDYIKACVDGIDLGFDSIYFDSCKHVIDKNGYIGCGELPDSDKLSWILYQIRNKTGRNDLSFVGEKCNKDFAFTHMGLTAGTNWGDADNISNIIYESQKQAYNREYAAGPEVSNDNDVGNISFETRLNRINSCLLGYTNKEDKLPSFMQLNDIMPLSPYTNTHDLMLSPKQMRGSDAWTECERHWDGVFNTSPMASDYTDKVYQIFASTIK